MSKINLEYPGVDKTLSALPKNNSVTGFCPVFVVPLEIIVLFLFRYDLCIDINYKY
jgi:hypothetical protein